MLLVAIKRLPYSGIVAETGRQSSGGVFHDCSEIINALQGHAARRSADADGADQCAAMVIDGRRHTANAVVVFFIIYSVTAPAGLQSTAPPASSGR